MRLNESESEMGLGIWVIIYVFKFQELLITRQRLEKNRLYVAEI